MERKKAVSRLIFLDHIIRLLLQNTQERRRNKLTY